jgi:hypothetical protein
VPIDLSDADSTRNWNDPMKNLSTLAVIAFGSLALAACNQTTVASNSATSANRTGYNSASAQPAATTYAPSTQRAVAMGGRYDADCRTKGPIESSAYSACLQALPATALVASNR